MATESRKLKLQKVLFDHHCMDEVKCATVLSTNEFASQAFGLWLCQLEILANKPTLVFYYYAIWYTLARFKEIKHQFNNRINEAKRKGLLWYERQRILPDDWALFGLCRVDGMTNIVACQ